MIKVIKFPKMDNTEYMGQDSFLFQWCCDCKSRHVWHFHIVRGKTPEEDYIVITCAKDGVATKLRKAYEKDIRIRK